MRPPAGPVEVPGYAHYGQVPAAVGPAGRPVGVHRAQPTLHVPGQGPVEDAAGEVDTRGHLSAGGPRHAGSAAGFQRRKYIFPKKKRFPVIVPLYFRFKLGTYTLV